MGESDLSGLAVINRASREITADGHSKYDRRFGAAVRAPAIGSEFVPNLHHGRPDVVEELDFGDGFKASGSHPYGAPDDGGFRDGRIEAAMAAEFGLQARRELKDTTLSFDFSEVGFMAAIGDV